MNNYRMPLIPTKQKMEQISGSRGYVCLLLICLFILRQIWQNKAVQIYQIRIYCVSSLIIVLNMQGKFYIQYLHHFWIAMSPARSKWSYLSKLPRLWAEYTFKTFIIYFLTKPVDIKKLLSTAHFSKEVSSFSSFLWARFLCVCLPQQWWNQPINKKPLLTQYKHPAVLFTSSCAENNCCRYQWHVVSAQTNCF